MTKVVDNFLDEMSFESGYDSFDESNIDEDNTVNKTKLKYNNLTISYRENYLNQRGLLVWLCFCIYENSIDVNKIIY